MFLLDFLESYSHAGRQEAEDLETQITAAAQEADDVIESHIVDQILAGSTLHVRTRSDEIFDHFLDFLGTYSFGSGKEEEASESQTAYAAYEADPQLADEILGPNFDPKLKSLCLDFFEYCSHGASKEDEASESQTASAAHEADDVSHTVDQFLTRSILQGETNLAEPTESLRLVLLETYSYEAREEAEASESQITSAAHEADDAVVPHIVDQIHAKLIKFAFPDLPGSFSALESQTASAAHEADNVIESHNVDEVHAGSTLRGETSPGERIKSLWLEYLEACSDGGSKQAEYSDSQIASAAHEADDVVESTSVNQNISGSNLCGETSPAQRVKSLWLEYLEARSDEGSEESESSESHIASAAHEHNNVIISHIVDQSLAGSTPRGETSFAERIKTVSLDPETSYGARGKAEASESQIASAVHEADDVIESHIVDQIHAVSTLYRKPSLGVRTISLLLDILDACSEGGSQETESSESQIASAAQEADDVIESHIFDQTPAGSTLHGETSLSKRIKSLMQDLETAYGPTEEAEVSESQIASAAHEADDLAESSIVDQSLESKLHGETSLREQVKSLLIDLLGFSSLSGSEEAETSKNQIASTAHEADDMVDSHVVDQSVSGSALHGETSLQEQIKYLLLNILETSSDGGSEEAEALENQSSGSILHEETSSSFLVDLQKVIENLDSLMQTVVKAQTDLKDQPPMYSALAASSRPLTPWKNAMVGFDDELIRLLELLTGLQSSRQIVSITGMGGIGKTTLAKNVYENSVFVHHFDIRIWATISQEYSTKQNLSELLLCLGKLDAEIDQKSVGELGEQLHKSLWSRRYLIILDDVWSVEAWDSLNVFFPENNNGSRIVVTSRHSDVAKKLGSSCLALNFLDEEKSWNLFCQTTFPEQDCPPELEETGKTIVKKCKGLPLLIVLIGGHLGNSSRTKQYWESVAKDINSILDSGVEEQCFDILALSYNYLPAHLKPCFLYMGIFPEDYKIFVSTLVKLWVTEGFLKATEAQTMEEVAEGCLKDLVNRNLVQVGKLKWNGKIKTCSIHDLLRELCVKIAAKGKFFHVLKLNQAPPSINTERRLVVHGSTPREEHYPEIFHAMESAQLTRSLLCHSTNKGHPCPIDYRLLKVLQSVEGVVEEVDESFMELKLEQVNLRYLDIKLLHHVFPLMSNLLQNPPKPILPLCLPSSISKLWNLQTLIVSGYPVNVASPEIWKMPQLRHITVIGLHIAEPRLSDDFVALENLQTLSEVMNFRLSEDVCKRIQNVKKLRVGYTEDSQEISYYSLHNIGCLQKLESLKCSFAKGPNWQHYFSSFTFPSSLQKLCLEGCFLNWGDLTMIGSLPHLEVLKLLRKAVVGSEWNPAEGEFLGLKFLSITSSDLIYWNAESCHFPVLEKLVFDGLNALDEIPLDIGEIPTLQFIHLKYCSVSAAVSTMRILVEQESLGNEDLRVEVMFSNEEQLERFREIVQVEDLSSRNLHLHC